MATIVYGEPRFTRDIDLVLAVQPTDAERFLAWWSAEAFYSPPLEVVREEAGRVAYGHFSIVHRATGLTADCYLMGNDPLHAWALERVRRLDVEGFSIPFAPVEYVIVRKLLWAKQSESTRHFEDIEHMLRIQGTAVDRSAVEQWASRVDCTREWHTVTKQA